MEVLDLSKRNDSAGSRKTPSPYGRIGAMDTKLEVFSPSLAGYTASVLNCPGSRMQLNSKSPESIITTRLPHLTISPPPYNDLLVKSEVTEVPQTNFPNISSLEFIRNSTILQQKITGQISPMISLPQAKSPSSSDCLSQKTLSPDSTSTMRFSNLVKNDGKIPRPFKAYPRDPLALAATFTATDALLDVQKAEKYRVFRKRMLEQMHAANGGRPTVTNPKMRRTTSSNQIFGDDQANDSSSSNNSNDVTNSINPEVDDSNNNNQGDEINQSGVIKDAAYYERRKKNNAAAKKSRDRRRVKEDEIAVRAAFLESENIELRIQLAAVKNQLALITATSKR